jgi:pseudouridine-5'-phosphate glycosidase
MACDLVIATEVAQALRGDRPVVALESALITHGFPRPLNLDVAREMEETVRQEGAVPATIAVLEGRPCVGLSREQMEHLAAEPAPVKISLRDLPAAVARGATGGTTVAATMHLAHRAGLRVFATGGIGGVHRGHPEDVSADLPALASIPMVVVCAGAKAILDLPRTLEMLETLGVPVVGYGTDTLPAFTSPTSGLPLPLRADSPEEVAAMARARDGLGLRARAPGDRPRPRRGRHPLGRGPVGDRGGCGGRGGAGGSRARTDPVPAGPPGPADRRPLPAGQPGAARPECPHRRPHRPFYGKTTRTQRHENLLIHPGGIQ